MIRRCGKRDFALIWAVINDGARAYKGVIPEDRWTEPYMSSSELQHEIDEGVEFWGYEESGEFLGVMGFQQVQDVTLIRHIACSSKNAVQNRFRGDMLDFVPVQTMSKFAVVVILIILVAGFVGCLYNYSALRHRATVLPGKFLVVEGRRMHLYCTGAGSPTIVIEGGLGDDWIGWQLVQPELARVTRVCSYDRAGLGWSDPDPWSARCSRDF